jgi:hypothetical protein
MPVAGTRLKERRSSVVDTQDLNPGLFTLGDANEMITEIKRLHSEERLMQVHCISCVVAASLPLTPSHRWVGRLPVCSAN